MKTNPVRFLKAQPRLFTAVLVGAVVWICLPRALSTSTRLLMAWDSATGVYLFTVLMMLSRSNVDRLRYRALLQDEGQIVILGLTSITALVSLGGVVAELATAKSLHGQNEWPHVALAGMSVLLSWSFVHMIFSVHYAHEYYSGTESEPAGGLKFPGHEPPDYWDFVYFGYIIGTACATADVSITSRGMRRITTLHCVVAFFFNTTILALTVNIGAGLF